MEGPHGAHRDLEGSGGRPLHSPPAQSGRRRSGRPCRPWRRAARRLCLPDRIASLLAGAAEDDLRDRAVRREFHGRGLGRRHRLHRRPLPDRQRAVRGHPAPRDLLSPRHSHRRAADGGVADIERSAGFLFPCPERGRGRRRRRDREGRRGERAHDRRRGQCPALFTAASAQSTGTRAADRGAFTGMAPRVRRPAAEPDDRHWRRQCRAQCGRGGACGCARISKARGDRDRSGIGGCPLADDAGRGRSTAAGRAAGTVCGAASAARRRRRAAVPQLLAVRSRFDRALPDQREARAGRRRPERISTSMCASAMCST